MLTILIWESFGANSFSSGILLEVMESRAIGVDGITVIGEGHAIHSY